MVLLFILLFLGLWGGWTCIKGWCVGLRERWRFVWIMDVEFDYFHFFSQEGDRFRVIKPRLSCNLHRHIQGSKVNFIYLFVIFTFKPHLSLLCRSTLLLFFFNFFSAATLLLLLLFFTFSQRLRFICSLFFPFLSYSSSPPSYLAAPLLYPSGVITRIV